MLSNIRQESCGNPADSVREGSGCCQQAAPKLLPVGIHTYTDVSVDGVDETLHVLAAAVTVPAWG